MSGLGLPESIEETRSCSLCQNVNWKKQWYGWVACSEHWRYT